MTTYRKLLLALLLVGIVPLLLAGAIVERAVRAYATGYAAMRAHADAGYMADAIGKFVTGSETDFQAMGVAISARDGSTTNWSEVLNRLRDLHPHFPTLGLVGPTGTVLASADAGSVGRSVINVPEQLRTLFRQALVDEPGAVHFTDLGRSYVIGRQTTEPGQPSSGDVPGVLDMGLFMPVDDAHGNRVGVLYGTLDTQPVMDLLAPYHTDEFPGLEAMVIDANGRVLFNRRGEANVPGELMSKPLEQAVAIASGAAQANLAPLLTLPGGEAYVSVKPIGRLDGQRNSGWRFVTALPYALVVAGINEGFLKASLVLLMIVTAALLAALWLARSLAGPIHGLTSTAEAMAAGNYSTRAASSKSREVNQLAAAFNRMADAVAAEKHRLEAEIAERRLAQARVDELQQRQELILHNVADGLLGVDVDGRVTFANPAAGRLLARESDIMIGRPACEFWCPADHDGADPCDACALTRQRLISDAGRPLQHVLGTADGGQLAVEYVVSPLYNPAGLQGAVLAFRDVRHRKAYELQMEQARLAAEAASQAKSQFLANMSHEIRTPMNGVLGFTSLLLETPLGDDQREHVDTIRSSAESLLNVINDILDFSKVEAGKMTVERLPFDLTEAVADVIELFVPQAEEKSLELGLAIAPDVPAHLEADPGRVRQVLVNLIGNAVKFTRQGHVLVEVESVSGPEGPRVRCSVSDTGVGVPRDKQADLFEPFSQADASTTRQFGGTGLGLIISKRLVELMGGDIAFESDPGAGSRFWFTLPQPAGARPASAMPPPPDITRLRVLVVDDHEVNRRLVSEQLRRWQVDHECVSSGTQALESLRHARGGGAPFHIAVLDYLMPGMDGRELGRRILADRELSGTRLIMLTSGSQRSEAETFLQAGFSAFLMKPLVRAPELLDAITRVAEIPRSVAGPAELAPPHPDRTTQSLRDARLRVLLAEDNAVNQRLMRHMLRRLGCEVDIAGNGHEALRLAAEGRHDVILMDCLMPGMDGYDTTAELRRRGCQLPIVALTANAMSQHREQCLAVGMDDYLSKPVRLDEVAAMLSRWGLAPSPGFESAG